MSGSLRASPPDLKVQYTGKLFGYYHIEPDERIDAKPDEPDRIKLVPVRTFLDSLSRRDPQQPDTLLLGMGDNFAPEFGASVQQEFRLSKTSSNLPAWAACAKSVVPPQNVDLRQWHLSAPEALYKSEQRLPELADCDNVTRFLITAGYRAIVPGREDFIYSATWLRRVALLLKGASESSQSNPFSKSGDWTFDSNLGADRSLHILAANVRAKSGGNSCPLLFYANLASKDHLCLQSDNAVATEMDWFSRLEQTLDSYAVEDSLTRQAAHDADFRMQTVVNQVKILSTLLDGYKCSVKSLSELSIPTSYQIDKVNGGLTLATSAQTELASSRAAVSRISCHLAGTPITEDAEVLRAAWAERVREHKANPTEAHPLFDTVIVMAQMPATEAEELSERVRADIRSSFAKAIYPNESERPSIDLILSEAQYGHETPTLSMHIEPGTIAPVLAPPDASSRLESIPESSISTATISNGINLAAPTLSRLLVNTLPPGDSERTGQGSQSDAAVLHSDPNCQTAACLLKEELHKAWIRMHPNVVPPATTNDTDLDALWNSCKVDEPNGMQYNDRSCQNTVLMQYLLLQLQRSSRTDVALLERRDFYFEWLGDQYGDYSVCNRWGGEVVNDSLQGQTMPGQYRDFYVDYCRLKVALDRVLWKGDYSERIMVDGATLSSLMKAAQQQTDQEQTLLARDLHQEWLMTYGIVTKPPTNLVAAASGPDTFSVPGSEGCANGLTSPSPYCINGQSVVSDRAYWITTSDQLAQDTSVYTALGSLTAKPNHYASATGQLFLTSEIADQVMSRGQRPELLAVTNPNSTAEQSQLHDPAEANLATIGMLHQDRNLFQVDFTKLVAGYTFTSPSLSDNALASDFSGVSNTQATTPHSQELDLEAASRLTSAPLLTRFVLGAQSDAEYDRKVTGNLTGNPETVTYPTNSYSVGGFTQLALHATFIKGLARSGVNQSTRNLPRAFLVLAPYQYQRQMTGAFLNFSFFTPPNASTSQQQVTVRIPTAMGFNQRVGLRYEFAGLGKWSPDPGSYVEIGPEYSVQNNVLSGIQLPQLASTMACDVVATQSLQTCVKNAYKTAGATLNSASTLIPVTQTLHTGGFYWTTHIQKILDTQKNYSASFDTQGDSFLLPGATLTTQTRYAFSTKLALNFKIAGNLSLSPTYSDYFFENQGAATQRTSVVTSTFTISAKWYFARDAQVPFHKQLRFLGPGSTDQTGSAKVK